MEGSHSNSVGAPTEILVMYLSAVHRILPVGKQKGETYEDNQVLLPLFHHTIISDSFFLFMRMPELF